MLTCTYNGEELDLPVSTLQDMCLRLVKRGDLVLNSGVTVSLDDVQSLLLTGKNVLSNPEYVFQGEKGDFSFLRSTTRVEGVATSPDYGEAINTRTLSMQRTLAVVTWISVISMVGILFFLGMFIKDNVVQQRRKSKE